MCGDMYHVSYAWLQKCQNRVDGLWHSIKVDLGCDYPAVSQCRLQIWYQWVSR
jgi:hypothetical protein